MNRFSRISTVWRKEFADTLRDRRTVIAMVLVPMVLYPALMLGSLQAFELQVGRLRQEEYTVAVGSVDVRDWLARLIAEDAEARAAQRGKYGGRPGAAQADAAEAAEAGARHQPPPYRIEVFDREKVRPAVTAGRAHVGVLVVEESLPAADSLRAIHVALFMDAAEIRSQIAAAGLEGILERTRQRWVARRLAEADLPEDFIQPLVVTGISVASPEKLGGSVLGQIVPLILVIMTITGAIYPAIDLTAGERERGTLETLMAAPVPTVDLIAGKFVVVASIGMLSAVLNLLSVGGTIYLAGMGDVLTAGRSVAIPLRTLPIVLVVLIPLAVMFGAMLLAVCSFARSFKEAQNYVMPVMLAALIPAVVGSLPGTELKGPLLIMPVTNIVILTRELFMGEIDRAAVVWVTISTCIYAGAAVAVAAKLFGQEAVLFADSASIRTLLRRRFFKPRRVPSAAHALLLLALVYSANFFVQQSLLRSGVQLGSVAHLAGLAMTLALLFAALPIAAATYARVELTPCFSLQRPRLRSVLAGLCFGCSTWVLALAWSALQQRVLPIPPDLIEAAQPLEEQLRSLPTAAALFFIALTPAFCEELFFRGYVLSGLRGALGKAGAVLVVAFAFGVAHYSVYRLGVTAVLGLVLGLLVVQGRSIWPAMLAHAMHNGITVLITRQDGLLPLIERAGFIDAQTQSIFPPTSWLIGAGLLVLLGVLLCIRGPRGGPTATEGLPGDAAVRSVGEG